MDECVFCKIIAGEVSTEFQYEDDICVVFKSIDPKAKTHFLVVPKKHISSISTMEKEDKAIVGHLIYSASKIARDLDLLGYKLIFNVDKAGGQEVFHIHLHLISNS